MNFSGDVSKNQISINTLAASKTSSVSQGSPRNVPAFLSIFQGPLTSSLGPLSCSSDPRDVPTQLPVFPVIVPYS